MPNRSARSRAAALRLHAGRTLGRVRARLTATAQASRVALPTNWKLETFEPKLLLSGDLAPGVHRIEGSIDQPGEQDRFEFSVQERTRFLFDGVQGDQISWQLQGPNNTDQF